MFGDVTTLDAERFRYVITDNSALRWRLPAAAFCLIAVVDAAAYAY